MHGAALADDTTGTWRIGGELPVRRLGFGAMRIATARGADGLPDRETSRALVRRAVERGVNLIDTANIYAGGESETIIAEALHPYDAELVITTKAGYRPGPILPGHVTLPSIGRPEHIHDECDKSLRRLRLDSIPLYQLHSPDPSIPYDETLGAFVDLQRAGKIRHIGISNVTAAQVEFARSVCAIASVQNRYNAGDRTSDAVVDLCTTAGIAFMPYRPVLLTDPRVGEAVGAVAARHGAIPAAVCLQWLLRRSPAMLPIPGTSQRAHLDANIDAAWLHLDEADLAEIDEAAR